MLKQVQHDEGVRLDWSRAEIAALFDLPFTELVFRAAEVHRAHHPAGEVQLCTLLSIKTGGCPEDCGYCSQSAHADTGLGGDQPADVDRRAVAEQDSVGIDQEHAAVGGEAAKDHRWIRTDHPVQYDRTRTGLQELHRLAGADAEADCDDPMLAQPPLRQIVHCQRIRLQRDKEENDARLAAKAAAKPPKVAK